MSKPYLFFPLPFHRYSSNWPLLGYLYYQLGKYETSLEFLEKSTDHNAENIRGNIQLTKKKWELAYGYFQLALKQKINSLNALERSIPLTWILKKWDKGLEFLNKVPSKVLNWEKEQALEIAFHIKKKKTNQAWKQLSILLPNQRLFSPPQLYRMGTFLSFQLEKKNEIFQMSAKACERYDGINCWIQLSEQIWGDLIETTNRKDKTTEENFSMEKWTTNFDLTPLTEEKRFEQEMIYRIDKAEMTKDSPLNNYFGFLKVQ